MLPFIMGSSMAGMAGTTGMSAAASTSPSWLPAIGGALGGAGQFAGGMSSLFGGSGGTDAHKMQKKSKKFAREMWQLAADETIQRRVRDAKKAGLHPLAALGISAAGGPGATFGMDRGSRQTGRAMANMGQGLQRVLAGKSELDSAMAAYYRAMAEKVTRPAIQGQPESLVVDKTGVIQSNKTYEPTLARKSVQSSPGYEGGKAGFYQFAVTDNGGVQTFPTQQLQESTSEGVHALEYGIKVAGKYLKGGSFNLLMSPKAMMSRNALRNEQRAVEKEFGGRFAYSIGDRTWYRTNTNLLYLNKRLNRFKRKYEWGTKRAIKSHPTYGNRPSDVGNRLFRSE